jgi:hypothetical protein
MKGGRQFIPAAAWRRQRPGGQNSIPRHWVVARHEMARHEMIRGGIISPG